MCGCIDSIKSLYDAGLYSNVIRLGTQVLAAFEQKNLNLSLQAKYSLTFLYADSLFKTAQYSTAEYYFRQLIAPNKPNKSTKEESEDVDNNVEIRYKIYQCCIIRKDTKGALQILQSIVPRFRSPKINMALGQLFKQTGMDRAAITCYKEVLKECPAAIEAMENLLELGMQGVEVNTYTVDLSPDMHWFNLWLKANAEMYTRDFHQALQTFRSLDTSKMLRNCPLLLIKIAYNHHYLGEEDQALQTLNRIHKLNGFGNDLGRDLLATILGNNPTSENIRCLETLCNEIQVTEATSDDWIILGNHMYAVKKYESAAKFAKQALMKSRNVEALLLEARSLSDMGKYQQASLRCSEALQSCSYRLDLHKCLIECYVKMNRIREADAVAQNACKQLNNSVQALTLHASVLLKLPAVSRKTVRKILEKAVEQDKQLKTEAVYMLAQLLQQEQQCDQAVNLLLKYANEYPHARLHQMLGDICAFQQKTDDAFHHYDFALRLDPNNQRAIEGMNNIDRNISSKQGFFSNACDSSVISEGTSDGEMLAEDSINFTPHTSFHSV